jgi:polygalacturonase
MPQTNATIDRGRADAVIHQEKSVMQIHRNLFLSGLLAVCLSASGQTLATGDSRNVSQPSTPSACQTLSAQFKASSVDVDTPPTSDDTSRIQSALSSCANTGKAVVLASSGSNNAFLSGKLTIEADESLVVNSGVTLYGNNSYNSESELIYLASSNSGIYGPGAIDGRANVHTFSDTPRLVQTDGASNFIAYNITLQNAAHPNLYIQGGSGATVWGITINTSPNQANADGIDIDSITDVTVTDSNITDGDDGIAVKTNEAAASNITVENSNFYGTHGISIGSQTFDGVTNVLFKGNYVYGKTSGGVASTDANAINIKTDPDCGGKVNQVTYENTCIEYAKHLIIVNAEYGSCSGTKGTPQFENIVVNGAKSTNSVSGAYETFAGYNSSNLAQIYLANLDMDNNTQSGDEYATIKLDNVNGMAPSGTDVTTSSFTLSGSVPSCSFKY